jgi:hypothetical protein
VNLHGAALPLQLNVQVVKRLGNKLEVLKGNVGLRP